MIWVMPDEKHDVDRPNASYSSGTAGPAANCLITFKNCWNLFE